jgi:hypothetical protein
LGGAENGVAKKEIESLEFPNAFSELPELIIRNYLLSFEIGMSIWKKNVEFLINQINQWAAMHQECNDIMKGLYGKSPFEVINPSESFIMTRDTMNFIQKTAERNWLLLNDCINLMLDLD